MNTLNIRLIGLAIALPLIAIQIAGAEDIKMTATKKLVEVKRSSDQSMKKTAKIFELNEDSINAQVESLNSIERKMDELKNDETIPAVRRAAMQKQYYSQKESLILEVLEFLDGATAEIDELADKLQDSLGEVGVAESYYNRYLDEDSKIANLKADGRANILKLEKLLVERESLESTDPERAKLRKEIRAVNKQLIKTGQEVMHRAKIREFLSGMSEYAEKFKEEISNKQDDIDKIVTGYDYMTVDFENKLELIRLNREAVDITSMPEGLGEIANTLTKLHSLGSQLSTSELRLPPVPDGSEALNVPTIGLDINQLKDLFSE